MKEKKYGWLDGGVGRSRKGLFLLAGGKPREDLAKIVGYLWLEDGRKICSYAF